jgi:dipeptidyl-peptidase-4
LEEPIVTPHSDRSSDYFSIEEVARFPLPGMAIPGSLAFSPDDRLVTYLFSPERTLTRYLYAFDLATGEKNLLVSPPTGGTTDANVSLEEALRRERMRQREFGITHYAWAAEKNRLLTSFGGEIFVSEAPFQPVRKLPLRPGTPPLDARFSPDGNWVAFVQDAELHVIAFDGDDARQLTFGALETGKTHGLAEYIAQEEMGRVQGYWWSPDSRRLAFEEVDETHIPVYRIMHQGKASVGEGAQEDHRYPFAGQANARVRLGVISVEGGDPVWMELGDEQDIYLARVKWLPDGRLSAQIENRDQTVLRLVVFDPGTGEASLLLEESSQVWINLNDMFLPLKREHEGEPGCFLWVSEHSGFAHLYLYNGDGRLIRQITAGEWQVDSVEGVDEERELIYFLATLQHPTEKHLYVVPFSGGAPRLISQEAGTHTVVLDHACERYLDTFHSLDQPPVVSLRSLDNGSLIAMLHDDPDPSLNELALQPPELVSLQNRAGVKLYGAFYRPAAIFGPGPYPTLVMVYGGPHSQQVANSWGMTASMRLQYLRSLGYLVFVLDNRGSARRGLDFEGAIKHDLGHLEVEDQVDGVQWLTALGLADPQRVGIFGWSYGGYMAAMCLERAPETFKLAVAGAPVSAWDGYDTHYTERYMGTPQNNPQGYEVSSLMHHVENMSGRLMLVHGMIDENVHFRHTARLVNALIAARKPYELLVFPDERHMPRKPADRIYMEERIRDFFLQNL